MIELEVPPLSMRNVVLEPDLQIKKGAPKSQELLKDRILLAEPLVRLISLETAANDQELTNFLKAEAGKFAFYSVHLGCSFKPGQGEEFIQATLEVILKRGDNVAEPLLPIAWSMLPQRDADIVEVNTSMKLSSTLKLLGIELPGIEVDKSKKIEKRQEFVVPMGEQTANPSWWFSETSSRRIFGSYLCTLVVRAPYGVTSQGSIGLSTFVRRMGLKLFPYKISGPVAVPFTFILSGGSAS